METALFVDFDNADLGLERLSYDVAARFGQEPRQWLRWLAQEFPCSPADSGVATSQRRVLIRRCYLNPVSFGRFRRPFLEAGFDVVDCPPMTAAGKTSTDVHQRRTLCAEPQSSQQSTSKSQENPTRPVESTARARFASYLGDCVSRDRFEMQPQGGCRIKSLESASVNVIDTHLDGRAQGLQP